MTPQRTIGTHCWHSPGHRWSAVRRLRQVVRTRTSQGARRTGRGHDLRRDDLLLADIRPGADYNRPSGPPEPDRVRAEGLSPAMTAIGRRAVRLEHLLTAPNASLRDLDVAVALALEH